MFVLYNRSLFWIYDDDQEVWCRRILLKMWGSYKWLFYHPLFFLYIITNTRYTIWIRNTTLIDIQPRFLWNLAIRGVYALSHTIYIWQWITVRICIIFLTSREFSIVWAAYDVCAYICEHDQIYTRGVRSTASRCDFLLCCCWAFAFICKFQG